MNTMKHSHILYRYLLVAIALALSAAPAFATSSPAAPLFGRYWSDFLEHWGGVFQKQNGMILAALGVGAVSLFIITRGKWKK
jgi:hypothetical protein